MAQDEKKRIASITRILRREYPMATTSLDHKSPFELLVATILSAQCTDERVNRVTPDLFRALPTPKAFAEAEQPEIEELIRSTGFFRSKARAIKEASRDIIEKHGGKVPGTMEQLVELRGVGRKTANVVLGNAFGVPGVVVDTHVGRVSRRLGIASSTDPVKAEHEIMAVVPRKDWSEFSNLLVLHGRALCTARRAFCEKCPIADLCPKVGVPKGSESKRKEVTASRKKAHT